MKKHLIVLLLLISCIGCSNINKNEINYTYEIKYENVDMSGYEGINSTNHMFKKIYLSELENCIDNKSSGVFYFGTTMCGCCQQTIKYLDEASRKLNVTVYYIDTFDDIEPFSGIKDCDPCKDRYDRLLKILDQVATENEDGKILETPTVFTIINGEIAASQICMNDENEKNMVDRYTKMLKPFIVENQD